MSRSALHTQRHTIKLAERIENLIEHVSNECMPPDHDIKRMGINEIKRWKLTLSPSQWTKFWNKLSPQQKQAAPNYSAVP